MSEKLWLPATKLGVPDPAVRSMPIVRLHGADKDSEAGKRLLEKFAGRIGQFHMASAHNYSLGPQQLFRAYRDHPDVKLRYTNVQGQEIIDVIPSGEAVHEAEEVTWKPWDWLRIDLTLPCFTHIYSDGFPQYGGAYFAARLRVPNADDDSDAPGVYPAHGRAFDYQSVNSHVQRSAEDPPLLQFAGCDTRSSIGAVEHASDGLQVGSLLVDIRPFFKVPQIVIELYGRMHEMAEDEVEQITGKEWTATWHKALDVAGGGAALEELLTTDADSLADVTTYYPEYAATSTAFIGISTTEQSNRYLQHYVSGSQESAMLSTTSYSATSVNTNASYPAQWLSGAWVDDSVHVTPDELWAAYPDSPALAETTETAFGEYGNGSIRYQVLRWNDGSSWRTDKIPSPPPAGEATYTVYLSNLVFLFTPAVGFVLSPVEPSSSVDVEASAFRGDPGWVWSRHTAIDMSISFSKWEAEAVYPQDYVLGPLASGIPIDGSSDEANADMDEQRLLGVVIFDQRTGGFSFTPA